MARWYVWCTAIAGAVFLPFGNLRLSPREWGLAIVVWWALLGLGVIAQAIEDRKP